MTHEQKAYLLMVRLVSTAISYVNAPFKIIILTIGGFSFINLENWGKIILNVLGKYNFLLWDFHEVWVESPFIPK